MAKCELDASEEVGGCVMESRRGSIALQANRRLAFNQPRRP
jgi:hypothetical protein